MAAAYLPPVNIPNRGSGHFVLLLLLRRRITYEELFNLFPIIHIDVNRFLGSIRYFDYKRYIT